MAKSMHRNNKLCTVKKPWVRPIRGIYRRRLRRSEISDCTERPYPLVSSS